MRRMIDNNWMVALWLLNTTMAVGMVLVSTVPGCSAVTGPYVVRATVGPNEVAFGFDTLEQCEGVAAGFNEAAKRSGAENAKAVCEGDGAD